MPPERVPVPTSSIELPQLEIAFDVGTGTVIADERLHGHARLRNIGSEPIRFVTGPTVFAAVRRPGDDHLAGRFEGWVSAAATNIDLGGGEGRELHLLVGTTSCLPDRPDPIPPGAYEVVATLGVTLRSPDGEPTGQKSLVRFGPSISVTRPAET